MCLDCLCLHVMKKLSQRVFSNSPKSFWQRMDLTLRPRHSPLNKQPSSVLSTHWSHPLPQHDMSSSCWWLPTESSCLSLSSEQDLHTQLPKAISTQVSHRHPQFTQDQTLLHFKTSHFKKWCLMPCIPSLHSKSSGVIFDTPTPNTNMQAITKSCPFCL